MAKVFIGMPAYNGERFIKEAIDSLRTQTFTDWQLFISDDTSKDSTPDICKTYAAQDKRITYFRQPHNLGIFGNFKFTLDKATGDYFMWASQDDIWEKDFIEVCIEQLEENQVLGLVTTNNQTIDSFGRKIIDSPSMVPLSGKPGMWQVAKYTLQKEALGKNNLMYGIFRLHAARATWDAYPQRAVWGQDLHVCLALVSRFPVLVLPQISFKKRLGGYSSPQHTLKNTHDTLDSRIFTEPKEPTFPLGRYGFYFRGHMEAVRGTSYSWLVALILILRYPQVLYYHVKNRSIINSIKRRLS